LKLYIYKAKWWSKRYRSWPIKNKSKKLMNFSSYTHNLSLFNSLVGESFLSFKKIRYFSSSIKNAAIKVLQF